LRYVAFGKENNQVLLLLHGGGLSWWNYLDAAKTLAHDYHVILPMLDGHGKSDREFSTIEANASALIRFIDQHLGGSVLLIGGLSLGGQVLLEMLSQRPDICRFAVIESALVLPSKLTCALVKPVFGCCYGLIRRRWFARLQFRFLGIKPSLFENYFQDTASISKASMISFMQANTLYALKPSIEKCAAQAYVYVGEKEKCAMQKSARMIHEKLPGSLLRFLPKMRHGEFSINHGSDYGHALRNILHSVSAHPDDPFAN